MSKCETCCSNRVLFIQGKGSDCHGWWYKDREGQGYAPYVPHICGGDSIELSVCLDCGKVQGKFPVESEDLERDPEAEARQEFLDNYGHSNCGEKFFSLGLIESDYLRDIAGRLILNKNGPSGFPRVDYCFYIQSLDNQHVYVLVDPKGAGSIREFMHRFPPSDEYEMREIVVGG